MATLAHCAYCFESLAASFERRQPLSLAQVEELWEEYNAETDNEEPGSESQSPRPAPIARILGSTGTSSPNSGSSKISTPVSASSKTSSVSSFFSSSAKEESHPLFITWNTVSKSGRKSLRGCIGTFEPHALSSGLQDYALTSAFEDHRFSPIPASLLSSLQVCVTLLTNFSKPDKDVLNWTVGEHGIRLSFHDKGRRYGATYLPDVAKEQGWTKEEALQSLMRKAGWSGRRDDWKNVAGLEIVRYEGKKVSLDYAQWKEWRDWVGSKSGASKTH